MDPSTTLTKLSTKSSCSFTDTSAPIILNLDQHDTDVFPSRSPTPTRPRVATRPLRRKQHLSIYRLSAPATSPVAEVVIEIPAAQRPHSVIPPSSETHVSLYPSPAQQPHTHNRSQSQPNIRLGHPRRPLYSAIRDNMSPPSSPALKPSRPTSMLPSFDYLPDVFDESNDDSLLSSAARPRPSSPRFSFGLGRLGSPAFSSSSALRSGSSAEMRMALANLAREARREQDPSFEIQDVGNKRASLSWRVRKLGQGLKDLVRGK